MEYINSLIDSNSWPLLTSFLLGILTSISPCPLATNITSIAYISKDIKTIKHTLLNSSFYILGRLISYTLLASFIYFGLSAFSIASIFQGWGDKVLGPVLIIIGLIMLGIIKFNVNNRIEIVERWKEMLSRQGYVGALLLGMLFALAFCPYSGVLFFGVLIPLVLKSAAGLLLPPVFAIGTGLPVLIFSVLIVFSLEKVGQAFKFVQNIEKIMRYTVASIFLLTGAYYTYLLVKYLWLVS